MPSLAHAIAFNHQFSYQHKALQLYSNFRTRNMLRQVRSLLTRQPKNLLNLSDVEVGATGYSSCFTGLRRVPLHQIVGSQGRNQDFDQGFVPRRTHTKDRWIRIATARLRGIPLPPVRVVKV